MWEGGAGKGAPYRGRERDAPKSRLFTTQNPLSARSPLFSHSSLATPPPQHAKRQVGQLKARLADAVGLPANKQKLNREGVGFLSDHFSLAFYNVGPGVVLTLGAKTRGRK